MKKKIILLILVMIFASGCDVVYTLELKNKTINEIMEINNYNKISWNNEDPSYQKIIDMVSNSYVATDYRKEVPEINEKFEGVNYYNIQKISTKDNLGVRYQNKFTLENYAYSTVLFENTEFFEYYYNNDKITFDSGENIRSFISYPKLDNLTVKFITNHDVISNNADEIKEGVYYWHFNRNNYLNKKIDLEISTKYTEDKLKVLELDEEGYFGEKTLVAIYIILGIILVISSGIIFFKVKNSNQ